MAGTGRRCEWAALVPVVGVGHWGHHCTLLWSGPSKRLDWDLKLQAMISAAKHCKVSCESQVVMMMMAQLDINMVKKFDICVENGEPVKGGDGD